MCANSEEYLPLVYYVVFIVHMADYRVVCGIKVDTS